MKFDDKDSFTAPPFDLSAGEAEPVSLAGVASPAFNPSPEQAAVIAEGPSGRRNIVVEALAGSGKTTTAKYFLASAREHARKRLYVAFNRSVIKEALEKLSAYAEVKSFHGLGYAFIRRRPEFKNVKPDSGIEKVRLRDALKGLAYRNVGDAPEADILACVSRAKNTLPFAKTARELVAAWDAASCEISATQEQRGWTVALCCQAALAVMEASKRPNALNQISFDDQIWLPVAMGWCAAWWDLVVADEAQDLNPTQWELVTRACARGGRIVLIGDDRQAIYEFRGAVSGALAKFGEQISAHIFPLTVTRRCPKSHVALAQKLVPDFQAHPDAPEGEILELAGELLVERAQGGDAVLARTNAPLVAGCLSFLRAGKRAYVEGRDIGAELIGRARKIKGATPVDFITSVRSWASKAAEKAQASGKDENAVARILDIAETLVVVAEESETVAEIISRLQSLFANADDDRSPPPADAVVFSTVHKAKGREWASIYILRDSFRKLDFSTEVNQETNILYVAVTRAKRTLTWVSGEVITKKTKIGTRGSNHNSVPETFRDNLENGS